MAVLEWVPFRVTVLEGKYGLAVTPFFRSRKRGFFVAAGVMAGSIAA
jgi:hypothetical protein